MDRAESFDIDQCERELFQRLVRATRTSNALPAPGEDLDYCATFPGFRQAMSGAGARVQRLLDKLLEQHGLSPMAAAADTEERYERTVDMTDRLLEQVDAAHDAARGITNATQHTLHARAETADGAGAADGGASSAADGPGAQRAQLLRPQLRWKHEIDNSDAPFVPRLLYKPNALVPLDLSMARAAAGGGAASAADAATRRPSAELVGADGSARADTPEAQRAAMLRAHASELGLTGGAAGGPNTASAYAFGHPYDTEVGSFEPLGAQLAAPEPQLYRPLHETPCTWVRDEAGLDALLAALNAAPEIAVDLEHHSLHSYRGFTCLLQISTRSEDFLVDVLELRGSLHVLNEPFTNPRITKVLHGADSDVIWLQRDFGLYLVGLFDTGQAAKALGLQSRSLSYVLKHYCGVHADKKFQLADWRLRPLTAEMQRYARSDTHYLLYCYDRLRAELHAADPSGGLLRSVWQASAQVSRQCYRVVPFQPSEHVQLLRKHAGVLSAPSMRAHRALFVWRDAAARRLDESAHAVLANHHLHSLAVHAPTSADELHSAWGRAARAPMPALIRSHADEIARVISQAVAGVGGDGDDGGAADGASTDGVHAASQPSAPQPVGAAARGARGGAAVAAAGAGEAALPSAARSGGGAHAGNSVRRGGGLLLPVAPPSMLTPSQGLPGGVPQRRGGGAQAADTERAPAARTQRAKPSTLTTHVLAAAGAAGVGVDGSPTRLARTPAPRARTEEAATVRASFELQPPWRALRARQVATAPPEHGAAQPPAPPPAEPHATLARPGGHAAGTAGVGAAHTGAGAEGKAPAAPTASADGPKPPAGGAPAAAGGGKRKRAAADGGVPSSEPSAPDAGRGGRHGAGAAKAAPGGGTLAERYGGGAQGSRALAAATTTAAAPKASPAAAGMQVPADAAAADFMRRIGWLRPDREEPAHDAGAASAHERAQHGGAAGAGGRAAASGAAARAAAPEASDSAEGEEGEEEDFAFGAEQLAARHGGGRGRGRGRGGRGGRDGGESARKKQKQRRPGPGSSPAPPGEPRNSPANVRPRKGPSTKGRSGTFVG